jgi:hypothetical protein
MYPEFDFVFLFDHSASHARQRPDGLHQHRMNKHLGQQSWLDVRNFQLEEGYLG